MTPRQKEAQAHKLHAPKHGDAETPACNQLATFVAKPRIAGRGDVVTCTKCLKIAGSK